MSVTVLTKDNFDTETASGLSLVDFWASWCKDCVLALPGTKELKAENPEIDFVYFSLDIIDIIVYNRIKSREEIQRNEKIQFIKNHEKSVGVS